MECVAQCITFDDFPLKAQCGDSSEIHTTRFAGRDSPDEIQADEIQADEIRRARFAWMRFSGQDSQ